MTTTEIRSKLHERINHLSETQLKELDHWFEEKFPEKQEAPKPTKKRKLGTMKSKIWLSDDWDSDEVNEEIARTFYEGDIFPKND